MKPAVLLLAHGAPERMEEVEEYIAQVRGGRPLAQERIAAIKQRYAAIGGGSPLKARVLEQAQLLQNSIAGSAPPCPVYVGMRNLQPSIRQTMSRMQADGVDHIVAICVAPQYSQFSVGFYFRQLQQARDSLAYGATVSWTKSYYNHPLLIKAFCERLAPLLPCDRVLFTAHSLPEKTLDSGDSYDAEARGTASAVALRAGLAGHDFAYQSQGMTEEPWLGPRVESVLDRYAREGVTRLVLAPIGFTCDHLEILYDVDVAFRGYAQERGMELARPESLNASPAFIAALTDVALEKLKDV
jgi:ferrochelatase